MGKKKLIEEKEIIKFPMPNSQHNVQWHSLIRTLEGKDGLGKFVEYILNPDFQRGHIWSEVQQIKFVEFMLRNGNNPSNHCRFIFWNEFKKDLNAGEKYQIVLVDGLQRITAVMKFIKGEIIAYGHKIKDYGHWALWHNDFIFCIATYQNELDVLNWYLALNEGGVVHTKEELDRIKEMIVKIKERGLK
jgi:hypothetical protein